MSKIYKKRKLKRLTEEEAQYYYDKGRSDGAREMRILMKSFSWFSRLFNRF